MLGVTVLILFIFKRLKNWLLTDFSLLVITATYYDTFYFLEEISIYLS